MSAVETLREAAREARENGSLCAGDPFTLAVAGLLDAAAENAAAVERMNARTAERAERTGGDGRTWVMDHALVGHAVKVARAYLGQPAEVPA